VESCSVLLAGAWSKENALPPLIPPKEGLGASIVDERVVATSGVASPPTKVVSGSVLERLCDPKVKGRGDGEDWGGSTCPKALLMFAGFSSSRVASPSFLGEIGDGTFSPDDDLEAASSKLSSFLGAWNAKGCFGSTVVVDPKFNASGLVSVSLLKEKCSAAEGVASTTDAEDNNTGAKAEPEEDDGVPVVVFSGAGSIFCADLSSAPLQSFSPSQKGFSASLTSWVGAEGTGSIGIGDVIIFNTGGRTGGAGAVSARN